MELLLHTMRFVSLTPELSRWGHWGMGGKQPELQDLLEPAGTGTGGC